MPDSSSQMKTAGETLKDARESKGLSLLTVHESTKIPLDVLKAIEEGYSVRIVSPFYFKGFIKMYAEYLGIDPVKVLEHPIPVLEKKKNIEPKIKKVREKVYHIPEDEFDFNKWIPKERQRQIVKWVGVLIVVFLCIRIAGCLMAKRQSPKKNDIKSMAVDAPKAVSPQEAAQQKLVAQPTPAVAASVAPQPVEAAQNVPSDKVRLVVRVIKGGWLQVRVDGNVVLESTLNAGAVERWEADQEIVISGRTIHNLEFEVDGKMLGALGRQDRNARRVIITKKGLTVSE